MSNSSSKIHLDKSEFLVISGIVFLFAGLMFSVGVMVGVGLNPGTEVAGDAEDDHGHASAPKHSDKGHDSRASRKIASEHSPSKSGAQARAEEKVSGKKLKDDYRKAKQSEFEEMLANPTDDGAAPTSAMDTQAYFLSRENKRDEDQDLPLDAKLAVEEEERKPASVAKKGAVPTQVKTLFERKPASANDYTPVYGEYTVLVSSFSSEDEAISKLGALRIAGFDDAYFRREKSGGAEWYRVGVGSFKDLKWALKAKETLKKKNLAPTPIVRKVE